MKTKSTNELDKMLENIKPGELDTYLKDNAEYLAHGEKAFYYYMKDVLQEKRIKLKTLYLRADVSESFGGQVLRMEKHVKDRDLILRFCLAGRFNLEETNRALKLYGMSELYAKEPRDACVIVAINNRIFDMEEVNRMLEQRGFAPISPDDSHSKET